MGTRHNWGADQAYFRGADGRLRLIPIAWTSLNLEDPVVVFGNGRAPFRLQDLLELARLIDALKGALHSVDRSESPIAPADDPVGGGSHV